MKMHVRLATRPHALQTPQKGQARNSCIVLGIGNATRRRRADCTNRCAQWLHTAPRVGRDALGSQSVLVHTLELVVEPSLLPVAVAVALAMRWNARRMWLTNDERSLSRLSFASRAGVSTTCGSQLCTTCRINDAMINRSITDVTARGGCETNSNTHCNTYMHTRHQH
jgi:hypothetical protein